MKNPNEQADGDDKYVVEFKHANQIYSPYATPF